MAGAAWFDKATARVIVTALLFVVAGAFVFAAWRVIVVFIFAIFVAYVLAPAVAWAQARRRLTQGSRARAILAIYAALGLLIAVLIIFAGPRLVSEGRRLSTQLPAMMDNLVSGKIAWQIGAKRGWSYSTQQHLQDFLANHRNQIEAWARGLGSYAAHFATSVMWIVLVPILAIFFLKDGEEIARMLVESVDRRRERRFLSGLISDIDQVLAQYMRAQLILAGLSIVAYTVVLSLIHLPFAVVLGVLSGVMEFVPVVGPLAAACVDLGVGFLTSFHHLWLLIAFLAIWRVIQDYVNSPRIMGGKLELHPLAVLFGVLAGGEVGGVIGVYLSIPLMATLRIFWRRYQAYAEVERAGSQGIVASPKDIRAA